MAVRVLYLPLGDQPTGFAHMHLSTQPEILCELASLTTFDVAHSVSLSTILGWGGYFIISILKAGKMSARATLVRLTQPHAERARNVPDYIAWNN
jgi:tRNA A22 N-methylase